MRFTVGIEPRQGSSDGVNTADLRSLRTNSHVIVLSNEWFVQSQLIMIRPGDGPSALKADSYIGRGRWLPSPSSTPPAPPDYNRRQKPRHQSKIRTLAIIAKLLAYVLESYRSGRELGCAPFRCHKRIPCEHEEARYARANLQLDEVLVPA